MCIQVTACIRNFIYLREAFSKLAMEAINPPLDLTHNCSSTSQGLAKREHP